MKLLLVKSGNIFSIVIETTYMRGLLGAFQIVAPRIVNLVN